MKGTVIFLGLMLLVPPSLARAEIPEDVLQADYQTCVGTDPDPNRAAYCQCINEGMKNWTLDDYAATAKDAETHAAQGMPVPARLSDLASQCIAQVLH